MVCQIGRSGNACIGLGLQLKTYDSEVKEKEEDISRKVWQKTRGGIMKDVYETLNKTMGLELRADLKWRLCIGIHPEGRVKSWPGENVGGLE